MRHSSILTKVSWCIQVALVTKMNAAFAFAPSVVGNGNMNLNKQLQFTSRLFSTTSTVNENEEVSANDNDNNNDDKETLMMSDERLPTLFPSLAVSLDKLGFSTPTPIQSASATRALKAENLLLIAATGSGKTLAYVLPALEKVAVHSAAGKRSTVLIVAPTRELAVQLMRDTTSILSNLNDNNANANDDLVEEEEMEILLAVKGVDIPSTAQLNAATVLIGTPPEIIRVLTQVQGGLEFIAGDALSSVILDEVDMLMPNAPKRLRTALDGHGAGKRDGPNNRKNSRSSNTPQDERRRQEQKRKLNAAQRNGIQISSTQEVIGATDTILKIVASRYSVGGDVVPNIPCQVIAGSATASRRTLDRLNKALYDAATEASSTVDFVWAGSVKSCRPVEEVKLKLEGNDSDSPDDGAAPEVAAHTIRAVTVPQQVKHQYIALDKESASSAQVVLAAVAKAANILKPKMALIFLCGDFGKPVALQPKRQPTAIKPGIKPSRTSNKQFAKKKPSLQNKKLAAAAESRAKNAPIGFSARQACSKLASFGIDATPLHVAMGLELNAKPGDFEEDDDTIPPFLVTFEGSARGLHIDNVDTVFVVGRPASAASYLHLAGRVGRATTAEDGGVVIRPGTVVSLCTKGSAIELTKWTKQIGGTDLEELVL